MNRTIKTFIKTALLWLLVFILLTAGYANAAPDWHKPLPCWGCHGETLSADVGGDEVCGGCHEYLTSYNKLDVPRIEKEHNPRICKACHIGYTLSNGTERELFHNGHRAVNCTRCHTEDNFTIIKIKSKGFECVSCHGTQVHATHIKNLARACPICHGSWASGKVYKTQENSSLNEEEEKDKLERFTIFSFIKNLFNALLGIK